MSALCSYCLQAKLVGYCQKCKTSGYCSRECQVKAWPAHRKLCSERVDKKNEYVELAKSHKHAIRAFASAHGVEKLEGNIQMLGERKVLHLSPVQSPKTGSIRLEIRDITTGTEVGIRLCSSPKTAKIANGVADILTIPLL